MEGLAIIDGLATIFPTEAVGIRVVMVMVERGTKETETGVDLTTVECAGQLVTVDAQLVMVTSLVEYLVS